MKFLTIGINPPALDCQIVAKSENRFGWGADYRLYNFDSGIYTEEEAALHMLAGGMVYWKKVEDDE